MKKRILIYLIAIILLILGGCFNKETNIQKKGAEEQKITEKISDSIQNDADITIFSSVNVKRVGENIVLAEKLNVPINRIWRITFYTEMQYSDLNSSNIYITDSKGNKFPAEVKPQENGKVVYVTPFSYYLPGEKYLITISKAIKINNSDKDLLCNYVMNFTVDNSIPQLYKDVVYDEYVYPKWFVQSWSKPKINTQSTIVNYPGKVTEVTFEDNDAWEALVFSKCLEAWEVQYMSLEQYKYLIFDFNPGPKIDGEDKIKIGIEDSNFISLVDLIPEWKNLTDEQKINKWFKVKIPLSSLPNKSLNGRFAFIYFFDSSDVYTHFYLDNVCLEWEKDKISPQIKNVSSNISLTYDSANISWETSEYTKYTFEAGINDYSLLKKESENSYSEIKHNVVLNNLKPGTTYRFKISANDIQNVKSSTNTSTYEGNFYINPAPTTPPSITNITVAAISLTYFTVTYNTNRLTNGKLYYGTTDFSKSVSNTLSTTLHSITVSELASATKYQYYIISEDAFGNKATSSAFTVETSNDLSKISTHFNIDTGAERREISPYIYGTNFVGDKTLWEKHKLPIGRYGGNRFTAYNWENNNSHAGQDWYHQNDDYVPWLICDNRDEYKIPGEAVRYFVNSVKKGGADAMPLVTIPMQGYVAFDGKAGDEDVKNTPDYLNTRFRINKARKGSAFSLLPDTADNYVYQDEFINWLKNKFPGQKFFYSLDNEPDLWNSTHPRIEPQPTTYANLLSRSLDFASMIKENDPQGLIFGPVSYGWYGYCTLQGAPDGNNRDFLDFYLAEMKKAEKVYGKRLLDVLDLHWYTEQENRTISIINYNDNTPNTVKVRVQRPRSLWDETYKENTWITENLGKGINLIPRLQEKININYPNTKLSFSEYNFGGGSHISGAVAQADVLGIFGKYNVFAGTMWEMGEDDSYLYGAFDMYTNYDGNGSKFGNTCVFSSTNDIEKSSVYASIDNSNGDIVKAVVINKSDNWIDSDIKLKGSSTYSMAEVYTISDGNPIPKKRAELYSKQTNTFIFSIPPMSVSTLVFKK